MLILGSVVQSSRPIYGYVTGHILRLWVRVMVLMPFSTIFSVISWQSVLLVEETVVPEKTYKLESHNVVSSTPRLNRVQTPNVSGDRY